MLDPGVSHECRLFTPLLSLQCKDFLQELLCFLADIALKGALSFPNLREYLITSRSLERQPSQQKRIYDHSETPEITSH